MKASKEGVGNDNASKFKQQKDDGWNLYCLLHIFEI